MRILSILCASLLAGWAGQASAQPSLYGVQAGRGAARIRFVNALDADVSVTSGLLPAQTLGSTPERRVGPYAVVDHVAGKPLGIEARQGARSTHLTVRVEPGSYTSIVLQQDGDGRISVAAVPRQAEFNQARALLSFYNAAPHCSRASLLLEPGEVAVFQDVPPGTAKSRGINPVSAAVSAACPDRRTPGVPLDGLEPGGAYSLWLMLLGGKLVAFLSPDAAASWHP